MSNINFEKNEAERIKEQYVEKKESELTTLRKLNSKVKQPAEIFAYTFGIIGALVLGTGMSIAMKVIGDSMVLGIIIGIVGIALVSINYFIYKAILNSRKQKYSKQIIELSDSIINRVEK